MKCPKCNMNMVKQRESLVYLTYPSHWNERWWCKCGYVTEWDMRRDKTREENLSDEWDRANNINYGNTTLKET